MKTTMIAVAVVIASITGILGVKAVKSHLRTAQGEIKSAVRNATPADYEVKRIKTLIAGMSQDVLAFGDKIAETEQTAEALREDVRKLEARLAADRADLLTERNLLAQEGEVFTIRGSAFSRAQIESSATARLVQIQRDQATLETKRQAIQRLKEAATQGQARLREAVAMRDAKIHELELLAAELANAELQQEIQALAEPLRDGLAVRSGSELAESLKAFADRVRGAQRQVEASTLTSSEPAIIAHGAAGSPEPGLLERIDRVIAPPAAPQGTGQ